MSRQRANIRLFVDQDLEQGREIAVADDRAHYLTRVMRLQPGDSLRLFNGRDGEWLARIGAVGRSGCALLLEAFLRGQRVEPGPVLAFAPIRKNRMHYLVEKATELGVERLLPVVTRNTVADRVNLDRMRAQAIEAAEQCGRLTIRRWMRERHWIASSPNGKRTVPSCSRTNADAVGRSPTPSPTASPDPMARRSCRASSSAPRAGSRQTRPTLSARSPSSRR